MHKKEFYHDTYSIIITFIKDPETWTGWRVLVKDLTSEVANLATPKEEKYSPADRINLQRYLTKRGLQDLYNPIALAINEIEEDVWQ